MKNIYNSLLIAPLLIISISGCGSDSGDAGKDISQQNLEAIEQLKTEATPVIQNYGRTLKRELTAAMKSGGPSKAIEVCKKTAPELAKTMGDKHGVVIKRISAKHRNPTMGEPKGWEVDSLNTLASQHTAATQSGKKNVLAKLVKLDDSVEFRMMSGINTDKICVMCHGSQLLPDVKKTLAQAYPDDKATGYKPGDFRGAFVYTKVVK